MINAIGLENPGIDAWIDGLPEWAALHSPVIVSVGGNTPDQYAAVIARLTLPDTDASTIDSRAYVGAVGPFKGLD